MKASVSEVRREAARVLDLVVQLEISKRASLERVGAGAGEAFSCVALARGQLERAIFWLGSSHVDDVVEERKN